LTVIASPPVPLTIRKSMSTDLARGVSRTALNVFHTAGTRSNHDAIGARPVKFTFAVTSMRFPLISQVYREAWPPVLPNVAPPSSSVRRSPAG
jgi:hypothetical protein